MVYNTLCAGEKANSLLGFGAMRFPTLADGKIDEEKSAAMLRRAYDNGVNYFDTAYRYHEGDSETFLAKALKGVPRESYLLADKLPMWMISTPQEMEDIFEEQLQKCGVEYFDYYLVHAICKKYVTTMREIGTVEFLLRKKAEGKIRHIGFSFHDDVECLEDVFSMTQWEFCQLQINYADWNRFNAKALYDCAEKHNVPVIVMEPVRGGFLAAPPQEATALLQEADPNRSMASWAFRYVASLPNVKLILSGMSTDEQVADNLKTFADDSVYLNDQERAVLDKAMTVLDGINTVPCTGCRYCMPCPVGVEIPTIFTGYNTARFFGRGDGGYGELAEASRADKCIACGACSNVCPQKIAVPDRLAEAHAYLTAKK